MQVRFSGFSTKHKNAINHRLFGKDLVIEDLMNQIMTRKGERIMMPTYGSIVHDMIFEPLTPDVNDMIHNDISRIVNEDPRAILENISVTDDSSHALNVKLTVSIIPTGEQVELTVNLERE
jgi:phage baseplate assembly protein W|tara:strand:+ start:199 stop:561 length:363 start_codon:yes stop_codon:yes gene_type:complete